MIITDSGSGWNSKTNFIDQDDVFVGYDTDIQCCEQAGWFISKKKSFDMDTQCIANDISLESYVFDTNYFQEGEDNNKWEPAQFVVFKLVKDKAPNLYLHLYNCHNGYYSHGFTSKVGGEIWEEGYL
jgi:hypothetical protein